jgi:hypothetical protein
VVSRGPTHWGRERRQNDERLHHVVLHRGFDSENPDERVNTRCAETSSVNKSQAIEYGGLALLLLAALSISLAVGLRFA